FASERVGERRKAAALGGRQAQSSAPVVGFENAGFLLEIRHDVWLVTREPAGDHRDEDGQDHGVPRVENRGGRASCSRLSTQEISRGERQSFLATIREGGTVPTRDGWRTLHSLT